MTLIKNADYIRSMSNEELYEFLNVITDATGPWYDEFDATYCKRCEPTVDENGEEWCACELNENFQCPYVKEQDVLKWWLDQPAKANGGSI